MISIRSKKLLFISAACFAFIAVSAVILVSWLSEAPSWTANLAAASNHQGIARLEGTNRFSSDLASDNASSKTVLAPNSFQTDVRNSSPAQGSTVLGSGNLDGVVSGRAQTSSEIVRKEVEPEMQTVDQEHGMIAHIAPSGPKPSPNIANGTPVRSNEEGRLNTYRLLPGSTSSIVSPMERPERSTVKQYSNQPAIIVAPTSKMPDRERFPATESNSLKRVADVPVSTLSVDVDTASYSYVRSEILNGKSPRKDSIRPEEMINYFNYDYPTPKDSDTPFTTNVSVVETPWNANTRLVQIGLQGYTVPLEDLPPQNLVFLIDTSGSMSVENKLPLLRKAFRLLVSSLRDEDTVAIVTYAGRAGVLLQPTSVTDKQSIYKAINSLQAGGRTAGHAGLETAYALAETMQENQENARIILATDGDFNVGLSGIEALTQYVEERRQKGIFLSVLGFGRGNYNDALMQTLAQNGNGTAAYIDSLSEARKVLVEQVVGSILTIAQDVKIQVEFNPANVAEYRLIGYETRILDREDFNNDKVDAGDIGAGHTVTAIYEVTPVGSPAIKLENLRYEQDKPQQELNASNAFADELAFVKLRYKLPGDVQSQLVSTPVTEHSSDIAPSEAKFAAAVAGFSQLLQGSDYLENWTFKEAEDLARANLGEDEFGYRSEFLSLLELATFAEH